RFQVQRLVIPEQAAGSIFEAAWRMNQLRKGPSATSADAGTIENDRVYSVLDARDGWIQLSVPGKGAVWAPQPESLGPCSEIFRAAEFCGDLLRFVASRQAHLDARGLTAEAKSVGQQIEILERIGSRTVG